MRVILMHDVQHTGRRGDILDVKPGYARNYLMPNGLALEANPGNLKVFEQQKRKIEVKHLKEKEVAERQAAEFAGVSVKIAKRVAETETLYGSVTAAEVAEALAAKGITVDKRRIDLEGGIKHVGEHQVRIELHSDVTVEIAVSVVAEE